MEAEGLDLHAGFLSRFPSTVELMSGGGGRHYWYWAPEGWEYGDCDLLPKLQIRYGGYLAAPPSIHPSGRAYEFDGLFSPDQHPIVPAPKELLSLIRERASGRNITTKPRGDYPLVPIGPILASCGWLRSTVHDGATLSEPEWKAQADILACVEGGRELFHQWSKDHPKYSQTDADKKFNGGMKAPGPPLCARLAGMPHGESCATCPARGKVRSPAALGISSALRDLDAYAPPAPAVRTQERAEIAPPPSDAQAPPAPPVPALSAEEANAEVEELLTRQRAAADLREVFAAAEYLAAAEDAVRGMALAELKEIHKAALALPDLKKRIKQATEKAQRTQRARGPSRSEYDWAIPLEPDEAARELVAEAMNDAGNANRLARRVGYDLRYCKGLGYLHFNGTHFEPDEDAALREATQAIGDIRREVPLLPCDDEEAENTLRKERLAFAVNSGALPRLKGLITLAQGHPFISIKHDQLDVNPWLVNCDNLIYDAETAQQHPHDARLLLTKRASASYLPGVRNDVWEAFLNYATGEDEEYIKCLQRAMGYSLSGSVREEKFFAAWGAGGTGKSTFVSTIMRVIGSYAKAANFDTFLSGRPRHGPRDDLAELAGARLVSAIESAPGRSLDTELIKQLTGGDPVTARHLYEREFTFYPKLKLWLVSNDPPKVRPEDTGLWRRAMVLPFLYKLDEWEEAPEGDLKTILIDTPEKRAGILNWLLKGLRDYLAEGLLEPTAVTEATDEYRDANDPLKFFIEERCALGQDAEGKPLVVSAANLRKGYEAWCQENGRHPVPHERWGPLLRRYGAESKLQRYGNPSKPTNCWLGIALVDYRHTDEGNRNGW